MTGYFANIEKLTLENPFFRKVSYTTPSMQLVLMNIKVGEEIGEETHNENDQFFRFEAGQGKVIIDNQEFNVKDGDTVIVPKGSKHNVINTSDVDLKMYTIYAPAHHKDGTIHKTKQEAVEAEKHEH